MTPATASFIGAFTYKRGPLLQPWRDLSRDTFPTGDCESFAWTVLKLEAGGTVPAIKALVTREAAIWRCWSKVLSLIHISEPTRRTERSRMPSSA